MKAHRFSLESVRTLRQQREQQARQRYARSLEAIRKAEARTRASELEWENALKNLEQSAADGMAAGPYAQARTGCLVLEIRWRDQRASLMESRRVAGLLLQELTLATQQRESLDQLERRARRQHAFMVRREEQNQLDELATQRNAGQPGLTGWPRRLSSQPTPS